MLDRIEALNNKWIDNLIDLQIKDSKFASTNGAIICPSCSRSHGRNIDALYSLLYRYKSTNDKKYLNAAIDLFNWTEQLSFKDGAWTNDLHIVKWKGITVFNSITLLLCIDNFEDILQKEGLLDSWKNRALAAVNFVHDTFDISTGIINYPMSAVYCLHLGYKTFNIDKFKLKSEDLLNQCLEYFNDDLLIFGEAYPQKQISKNKSKPIDIPYNMAESLTFLMMYFLETKNEEKLSFIAKSLEKHLLFFLNDGGIDSSWCTRNYKWTYWGSRTTDSCINILLLLSKYNPAFYTAAKKHLKLLEQCSKSGILSGGLHYDINNIPACIHHTTCHTKSFSILLDYINKNDIKINDDEKLLPINNLNGTVLINDANVFITNKNKWRSTVNCNQIKYSDGCNTSGGNISLLYHDDWGPILAAGLNEDVMVEAFNMQAYIQDDFTSASPCLIIDKYTSLGNLNIKEFNLVNETININATLGDDGAIKYQYTYNVDNNYNIKVNTNKQGIYRLPVIINEDDKLFIDNNCIKITRSNKSMTINLDGGNLVNDTKVFNFSPGFNTQLLEINFNSELKIILTID